MSVPEAIRELARHGVYAYRQGDELVVEAEYVQGGKAYTESVRWRRETDHERNIAIIKGSTIHNFLGY